MRFPKGFWHRMSSGQIAGIYFVASILWILFSDQALGFLGLPAARVIQIAILKGIVFVAVSTWLVYSLLEKARARAAEELRIHRAYLDELFDTAPEAICILDMNSQVLSVNQEFNRMFGYEKKEVVGRNALDLIVPDELRTEVEGHRHSIALGERLDKETIRTRKDGTHVHVSMVAALVTLIGGAAAIHVVYRDITDRIRAEAEMAAAKSQAELAAAQLRTIVDTVSAGLHVRDADGYIVLQNEAARNIYGTNLQLVAPHVSEMCKMIETFDLDGRTVPFSGWPMSRILRGERVRSAEMRVRFKGIDKERILRYNGSPVLDSNGKLVMAVMTSEDITDRKRAEHQLQATAERLRAILDNAPWGS